MKGVHERKRQKLQKLEIIKYGNQCGLTTICKIKEQRIDLTVCRANNGKATGVFVSMDLEWSCLWNANDSLRSFYLRLLEEPRVDQVSSESRENLDRRLSVPSLLSLLQPLFLLSLLLLLLQPLLSLPLLQPLSLLLSSAARTLSGAEAMEAEEESAE